ncbi:MAG: helix-turn-helix domain-containing protein [Verrucomicrobiota bacterium]
MNALILLNCDAGVLQGPPRGGAKIASVLRISQRKIDRVKERFVEHGIEVALNKQVPDRPDKRKVDGDLEA